jgi:hypothetical protein
MGYNIEISINMLKESRFSEVESIILETANLYGCDNIYSISEEDGTTKIPRYHYIFIVHFLEENFDNFVKFVKIVKSHKKGYIECIYSNTNTNNKLIYASSYYLNNIHKDASQKYKQFVKDKSFTENEYTIIHECRKK